MPLINGMKMACEPCIRGHRSTKCTHANERLMVPVRKPGRPLSACPHLRDQMCGCHSVTAAIPRKQTCPCGNSTPLYDAHVMLKSATSSSAEVPLSPCKSVFRVDKNHKKPHPIKKSSSGACIERMNACQMSIHQTVSAVHPTPIITSDGYCYIPSFTDSRGQYPQIPVNISLPLSISKNSQEGEESCCSNEKFTIGSTYEVNRTSLISPGFLANGDTDHISHSGFLEPDFSKIMSNIKAVTKEGAPCCGSLKNFHIPRNNTDFTSSLSPETHFSIGDGVENSSEFSFCCMRKLMNHHHHHHHRHHQVSSPDSLSKTKDAQNIHSRQPETTQILNQDTASPVETQNLSENSISFNTPLPPFYSFSSPQHNIFPLSGSYGSFENPLDASIWRQTQENMFSQSQNHNQSLPFYDNSNVPESLSLMHNCNCGDHCQCVGCASHPYNDATQDYVRSAWQSMLQDYTSKDYLTNDEPLSNEDESTVIQENVESKISSIPPTPSSLPANGEEQNLPENDFLFVNYSLPSEGCSGDAGDTFRIPCGEDCHCIECETHKRNPG